MFNSSELIQRLDYIIGIKKFTGNSSYPKNQGLFSGIIWDYIIFLCLLIQKSLLETLGFWNYVKIS
jgi:hypothetical protein